MTTQEVFDKLERKKLLCFDRNAVIKVNRTVVNEESLRDECERLGYRIRAENGMLIVG